MLLKWMLISAISMVSFTMMMFVSAFSSFLDQAAVYYEVSRGDVIFLANSFNICYLVISPFIFSILKKYYLPIVNIAVFATGVGCIGRYLAGTNYNWALFFSLMVGIAHVPIITAPYGLLSLFPERHQSYASSIPLFVPILGINVCILYGIFNVTTLAEGDRSYFLKIDNLNAIIALVALISVFFTIFCLVQLKDQVKEANRLTQEERRQTSCIECIKQEFSRSKIFFGLVCAWGTVVGINWTYGGMFDVIFIPTGMNGTTRAIIGLFANLSSILFSNLGTWISNNFSYSNYQIIFRLQVMGILGSLFIQASATIYSPSILQNQVLLIVSVIILRAGFSSFVSLALINLDKFGMAPVLVTSIFFYIANGSNLLGNLAVDKISDPLNLALLNISIWGTMIAVHFLYLYHETIDSKTRIASSYDMSEVKQEQEIDQDKEKSNFKEKTNNDSYL